MKLNDTCMAYVLSTIRKVPEDQSDNAWGYIASRCRLCGEEPTISNIWQICGDVLRMYAGPAWHHNSQRRRGKHE